MSFKCIIFDFDGTLADSKTCGILATQDAFKDMKLATPSEQIIEYFMGIPIERSFVEMADKRLSAETLESLITIFRKYYKIHEDTTLKVFEGIPEVLQKIIEKEISCFVVSSKHTTVLNRNLKALGIADFFKEAIGSDKVSDYKPHPEGVHLILNKYNYEKNQSLMIGDAVFDIQMGKSAGIKTGAVTWGSHSKENLEREAPSVVFESPREIIEYAMKSI